MQIELVVAFVRWACTEQRNQSLHFVVFLFLVVLVPLAPVAAEPLGERPLVDAFGFFLVGRAGLCGDMPDRCPAAEDLPPLPENEGKSSEL